MWLRNIHTQYSIISTPVFKNSHVIPIVFFPELGNFEPRNLKDTTGPGEKGRPYHMSQDRANDVAESESEYGMNIAASDDIAMNR